MVMDGAKKQADGGATDAGRDTSANSGQTAAAEEQTSTIDPEKSYKGADVQKLVADALAADGREQKTRADGAEAENKRLTGDITTLTGSVDNLTKQMSAFTDARDAAELEAAKGDHAAVTSIAARQANAKETMRLEGIAAENTRQTAANTAKEADIAARGVATDIKLAALAGGVDEKALGELVPDGNAGRLGKAVAILKGQTTAPILDADGKVKIGTDGKEIPAALRQKPASAVGTGSDTRSASERMLEKAKANA